MFYFGSIPQSFTPSICPVLFCGALCQDPCMNKCSLLCSQNRLADARTPPGMTAHRSFRNEPQRWRAGMECRTAATEGSCSIASACLAALPQADTSHVRKAGGLRHAAPAGPRPPCLPRPAARPSTAPSRRQISRSVARCSRAGYLFRWNYSFKCLYV